MSEPIEIPNRALFKAAEVCTLLKVQPYVLRTWEAEFRDLGVAKGTSGARVYRREDVERVQRIKHMLLIEGLTLAGVRRRLEEEAEPPLELESIAAPAPVVGDEVRERIGAVRRGLRSLLELLNAPLAQRTSVSAEPADFALASPGVVETGAVGVAAKGAADDTRKAHSPRRKRSA